MAKYTLEQRIERAHVQLMGSTQFCFLSGVFMVGKVEFRDEPGFTAATDGYNVFYGREFCESLQEKELAFLVCHENYHKMLRQLTVWKRLFKQNAQLANASADFCINGLIVKADPEKRYVQCPKVALIDSKYDGMDTKQIWDALLRDADKNPQGGGGQGQPGQGQGQPGDGTPQAMDEHMWEKANEVKAGEQAKRDTEIDNAIRQGQILAGKRAGGRNRDVDALLEPKVDWRKHTREFVQEVVGGKDVSTWSRPNRRYLYQDVYMPGAYAERVGEVVIGVDTSGSIGGEQLREFLSEVVSIANTCQPEKLHLLYWDAEVARHEVYLPGQYEGMMSQTQPAGGGGTSPSCVTEYLTEKRITPVCSVMLTDGYVGNDWGGQWPSPVLWCIVGNNNAVPSVGKSVKVQSE